MTFLSTCCLNQHAQVFRQSILSRTSNKAMCTCKQSDSQEQPSPTWVPAGRCCTHMRHASAATRLQCHAVSLNTERCTICKPHPQKVSKQPRQPVWLMVSIHTCYNRGDNNISVTSPSREKKSDGTTVARNSALRPTRNKKSTGCTAGCAE